VSAFARAHPLLAQKSSDLGPGVNAPLTATSRVMFSLIKSATAAYPISKTFGRILSVIRSTPFWTSIFYSETTLVAPNISNRFLDGQGRTRLIGIPRKPYNNFLYLVISSISAGGCAIHPLPEDVTGVPTYVIVRQIRCETRDAIRDSITGFLSHYISYPDILAKSKELKDDPSSWISFTTEEFGGGLGQELSKFGNSAIAYDFSFDITEKDNSDASASFVHPLQTLTATLGLSAGMDRARQNIRSFTVTDTFINLITKVGDDYCIPGKTPSSGNYIYPITGRIGVSEMVSAFVDLATFGNLAPPGQKSGVPPTLTDALTFTTTISGSTTPTVTFTPVGHGWQIASAALTSASVTRQDVHSVIIALALPLPKLDAVAKKTGKTTPHGTGTSALSPTLVNVSSNATEAELLAALAIQQYIIRYEAGKSYITLNQ
jgi:hypothetical protein